ncbi:MAG: hypothetical protein ACI4QG_06695, partial [Candidatus Cryptobacteroides sp.]
MKKSIYILILLTAFLSGFVSCRRTEAEILTPSNQMDYRLPSEQFLSIWNSMNTNYAMWDLEKKDWGSVKEEFLPEFLALDDSVRAGDKISTAHLKKLYTDILGGLTDHHSFFMVKNIWASDEEINTLTVYPSKIELRKRDYFHDRHINSSLMSLFLQYESFG